jgi:DNA-binding MarR family transcriptional regulator
VTNVRRAKLVVPTDRGRDVIAVAQELVPEVEQRLISLLGADRFRALGTDLETVRQAVPHW